MKRKGCLATNMVTKGLTWRIKSVLTEEAAPRDERTVSVVPLLNEEDNVEGNARRRSHALQPNGRCGPLWGRRCSARPRPFPRRASSAKL
jgi:hypothetical protein